MTRHLLLGADADLRRLERDAIERALIQHRGNVAAVARALGTTRETLYGRLYKYWIDGRWPARRWCGRKAR